MIEPLQDAMMAKSTSGALPPTWKMSGPLSSLLSLRLNKSDWSFNAESVMLTCWIDVMLKVGGWTRVITVEIWKYRCCVRAILLLQKNRKKTTTLQKNTCTKSYHHSKQGTQLLCIFSESVPSLERVNKSQHQMANIRYVPGESGQLVSDLRCLNTFSWLGSIAGEGSQCVDRVPIWLWKSNSKWVGEPD